MQQEGAKIYLTIEEQIETGYDSPIDLSTFPLHEMREKADTELDKLEAMEHADSDELTHAERASLPIALEHARVKSKITREIGRIAATFSLIHGDPSSS
jgi:hypothetical protein